jgi:hypothetical protein
MALRLSIKKILLKKLLFADKGKLYRSPRIVFVTIPIAIILLTSIAIQIIVQTQIISSRSFKPIFIPNKNVQLVVLHSTIQQDVDSAKNYINSLYKDDYPYQVSNSSNALMAEYPSIPLHVKLSDGTNILAGQNTRVFFFIPTSEISNVNVYPRSVHYDIIFRCNNPFNFINLHVDVKYHHWTGTSYRTLLIITQNSFNMPSMAYANVYLGTIYIGQAGANKNAQILGRYISSHDNNEPNFSSIRYTERHGTQLGYEWYLANNDYKKATKLSDQLLHDGFHPHKDLYSPLFGTDTEFADNYLYESRSDGIYHDCFLNLQNNDDSYVYRSRVCTFGLDLYIWYSLHIDWLVPTLWAIHLLNKYGNPDTKRFDGNIWWSPRQVARFVETKWMLPINNSLSGAGISYPLDKSVASSVRTAVFEVLETILGYRYGDPTSRIFADSSASALDKARVHSNGKFISYNDDDRIIQQYQRGSESGGFYTSWRQFSNGTAFVAARNQAKEILDWLQNGPIESPDITTTNLESTITISQALRVYDSYKYDQKYMNIP